MGDTALTANELPLKSMSAVDVMPFPAIVMSEPIVRLLTARLLKFMVSAVFRVIMSLPPIWNLMGKSDELTWLLLMIMSVLDIAIDNTLNAVSVTSSSAKSANSVLLLVPFGMT